MWLLIDDMRNLSTEAIARTPEAAKQLLSLRCWYCVCFDHDLGCRAETGYDILVWAINNEYLPSMVQLVTSNPVGRERMAAALEHSGYTSIDGINFKKGLSVVPLIPKPMEEA